MKKILLALTLALCLALSLVALTSCGGNGDNGDGTGDGTGDGGSDVCTHTWASVATVDTAATCTTDGVESIKCTSCGEKKADSETAIPAIGHNYTTASITAPTCVDEGSETKICLTCNDSVTNALPVTDEHVWRANAVIDVVPTCTEEGMKSIRCIYCEATKPDSVQPVPANGHTSAPVVLVPTVFSEGLAEGECTACGEVVSEVLPKTEPAVETFTASHNAEIRDYENFYGILGDDHFYPTEENPNGNSLYVEFSFLWNETLANVTTNEAYAQFGRINGPGEAGALAPFWFAFGDNCDALWNQVAGGFELGQSTENIYGPRAGEANGEYPGIGGYGWHRIGMEYTQLTETRADGSNMIVSLYIDGELISTYYYECDERCLLYTGDAEYGYDDNLDAKILFYRIVKPATSGENAYFVTADHYVSVGGGFVMKVTPVENPEDATFTVEEGVELPAKAYFAVSAAE